MARTDSGKRPRLVQAAVKLVHERGFHRTTLADVAQEAGVPPGNVYYYFKTKEELGEALIEEQAAHYDRLRREWETSPGPRERLNAFIGMTLDNRESLARSGCPIGTLCDELGKDNGSLGRRAGGLFAASLDWLERQFRALGKGEESAELAVHLLSALEGATLLTHTFGSTRYVEGEAERLRRWLDAL